MKNRVQIQNLVTDQQPSYVKESYSDFIQLLKDYYRSLEFSGGPKNILNNIDDYIKLENISELIYYTELSSDITTDSKSITVTNTDGFPSKNGFIKIDDEIIFYDRKTKTEFLGCQRGFSGITDYSKNNFKFSTSFKSKHVANTVVYNLNALLLFELYKKFKSQYTPGFEEIDFYQELNEKILVSRIKDFYSSRGTDKSFEILFNIVWGVNSKIIKPRDYIIQSSDADYRITRKIVVEAYEGNPLDLAGRTLFEDVNGVDKSAFATIISSELVISDGVEYYSLTLDYNPDVESFNFSVHSKTKTTDNSSAGQTYLDVDSTLGFADSGSIEFYDNGVLIVVEYNGKNDKQFFNLSLPINLASGTNILDNKFAYSFNDNNEIIKVRVKGVLGDINYDREETYFYEDGDNVNITSLGKESDEKIHTTWFLNTSPKYNVKSLFKVTEKLNGISQYRVETFDDNIFRAGDTFTLVSSSGEQFSSVVISFSNTNVFDINVTSFLNLNKKYVIKRNISKPTFLFNSNLNIISSNVQNVYIDKDDTYVTSTQLPSYLSRNIGDNTLTVKFSASLPTPSEELIIGNHPFITGDSVYYSYDGNFGFNLPEGQYFVKRVSDSTIKLASSRSNIRSEKFLELFGTATNNKLILSKFYNKSLYQQNIIRKYSKPVNEAPIAEKITVPGAIGCFLNGVELLNYKSTDTVFYGQIVDVIPSSPGDSNYDVINPPKIEIIDNVGSGGSSGFGTDAVVTANVRGVLKRVDVIDPGFGYESEPIVTISGGNGFGAKVKCNLTSKKNEILFNTSSLYNQLDLDTGTIDFKKFNRFKNFEAIVYNTLGQDAIGGLVNGSIYYVVSYDGITANLYNSFEESVSGINTITFSSYGDGIHKFTSVSSKNIISSVDVLDSGSNYTNKILYFDSTNIRKNFDVIGIKNHGFLDKEIVIFNSDGVLPTGLSSTSEYYVKRINENEFKVYEVLSTELGRDFNYNNKLNVIFSDFGSGQHRVSYTPISIKVEAPIGINTVGSQSFTAKLNPIFGGEIFSTSVKNPGRNYGDNSIINYNRKPTINLYNGENAKLLPTVSSQGKIIGVTVIDGGSNYNSAPILKINGDGFNAVLTAIIVNGRIESVTVLNSGFGYTKNTSIEVISNGFGASFDVNIQTWTINLVEKLFDTESISVDDGIIYESKDISKELAYGHGFASRGIREQCLASSLNNDGNPIFKQDLLNDNDTIKYHSPIIGWAYDGNPIYGPYGYANIEGGPVKKLSSGYELRILEQNRPPVNIFPVGYFVEDYIFTNAGDLDISNGRFCKTPEFPNGVYAYFSSFNENKESTGDYNGFLKPRFPYVIGNSFNSKPIPFNFNDFSNLSRISVDDNWFRFTSYFGFSKENTFYDGLVSPETFKKVLPQITNVSSGSVDKLNVVSGGNNYSAGDQIYFENKGTFGSNAFAVVKSISGRSIGTITFNEYLYSDLEFSRLDSNGNYLGISSHFVDITNNDIAIIDDCNIISTKFIGPVKSLEVKKTNKLNILSNLGNSSQTGIVTYLKVNGDLNSVISVGDVYKSNEELFKVLNIYSKNYTIKVERSYAGSISTTHSPGDTIEELPRKLIVKTGLSTDKTYNTNSEYYFNPTESIIIGSENLLQYSYPISSEELPGTPWTNDANITGSIDYFQNSPIENKKQAVKISIADTTGNSDYFLYGYNGVSLANEENVFSVFLKGEEGGESVYLIVDDGTLYYGQLVTLTKDYRRYTFKQLTASGTHNFRVGTYGPGGFTLNSSPTFYVWGAQVERENLSLYYQNYASILQRSDGKSGLLYLNVPELDLVKTKDTIPNTIFLPNHKFILNDKLSYTINDTDTSINVSYATTTKDLTDVDSLYVVPYSNDYIGLSTQKVSIGSSNQYVGIGSDSIFELIRYNNYGVGNNQKLKTNRNDVIKSNIVKKYANIITKSPHGLVAGNEIDLSLSSNKIRTVKVSYDNLVYRTLINKVEFTASDVNIDSNTISIINHHFKTGDKVIYNSENPSIGLVNSGIYYIVSINSNEIGLSNQYYSEIFDLDSSILIDIQSQEDGSISLINPQLKFYRNETIIFDLSDRSLQYNEDPSFTFEFYTDVNFSNKYYSSSDKTPTFNVTYVGDVGSDGAYVQIKVDSNTPKTLYYRLNPINLPNTPASKLNLKVDFSNIENSSSIQITDSVYSGKSIISGITTTSFTIPLNSDPEQLVYTENDGLISYRSPNAIGPINEVSLVSKGRNYKNLPYVTNIVSSTGGNGAIFLPFSNTIGKIDTIRLLNIGLDYPSDKTLRPSAIFPSTYKIEPLSKFKSIKIDSFGTNYFVPPQLVVLDGFTGRINDEAQLKYDIGDTEVSIIRNTTGLYNVTPKIIPVNNPNGIRISNISFNSVTNDVTVAFAVTFATASDFPFNIGDNVIIENTNIDLNVGGKGYNSSAYGYTLFKVKESNPNIGGEFPSIVYNISDVLKSGESPGIYDEFESFGTATPESYFPVFNVTLEKGSFNENELVIYEDNSGIVERYDTNNEYIKIRSSKRFSIGDIIYGQSSKNLALISSVFGSEGDYEVSSSSIVREGWRKETGKLNTFFQRMHDNDYYQYFSYSVKSPLDFTVWNPLVSNLTHTVGFKKFSDLVLEPADDDLTRMPTEQDSNVVIAISDLTQSVNINTVKDFDIAREKSIKVDESLVSNEILFNLPFLAEYREFIGNRVLTIDDISDEFDSNKKSFNLFEKNNPIFEIEFDATDSNTILTSENNINLKNHFFVSGEEVEYVPHNGDPNNGIQISPINWPGIGITSRLPSRFYVIKEDNQRISIAATIGDSLQFNPNRVDIVGLGAGNSHKIRSIDANNRLLISINGSIQSPIVGSGYTIASTNSIGIGDTNIQVDTIDFIKSGDLIKIDNEILLVKSLNGLTNQINVERSIVGTEEESHNSNTVISKLSGNFNIVGNTLNFSEPIWGKIPVGLGTTATSNNEIDYTGLTTSSKFSGRVFLRSALNFLYTNDFDKAYDNNYVYDDISSQFNGISTTFNLKYEGNNITNIPYTNTIILIDGIFQGPQRISTPKYSLYGDYKLFVDGGNLKVGFNLNPTDPTITKDINVNRLPKGGIIVSTGSTEGFGYQPLVSAGGTALINALGGLDSIAIGNTGSGYRSGLQTVKVGLRTDSYSVVYVGEAVVNGGYVTSVNITNPPPAIYSQLNPPEVIFDAPLNYINLPLIYSNGSSGLGTEATVDLIPSNDGTIRSFEIKNYGYGYNENDTLTVSIGGTVGIQTLTGISNFKPFELNITEVFRSQFSGWNVGEFIVLDDVSKYFNGVRRLFPLQIDGEDISFYAKTSSGISLQSNLLVFVNDVLQTPGEGYQFNGGSRIRFSEAPKGPLVGFSTVGDTVKILAYTGTSEIDVRLVRVLPTVKVGDNVQIFSDIDSNLTQEKRLVVDVKSADTIITNNYADVGVVLDELYERPINWIKQNDDLIIDNSFIGKDRVYYEPIINPSTNILNSIAISSEHVYVFDTSLFDISREGIEPTEQRRIEIIPTDELISAEAEAVLNIDGTIASINVTNPGLGYTLAPIVTIQKPFIDGSQATAFALMSGSSVNSVNVSYAGTNYYNGPIKTLSIYSQGSGFPPLFGQEVIMTKAKLNTITGVGRNATVNITINPETYIASLTEIDNKGVNYSVGDILELKVYDNVGLANSYRRWPLENSIKFIVNEIEPPPVLIAPPWRNTEESIFVNYYGDYGIIVGFDTSRVSESTNQYFLGLDLFVPMDSDLRKNGVYDVGITTGDYFNITNTIFGDPNGGRVSLPSGFTAQTGPLPDPVGISTIFTDMVVQCYDWSEKIVTIPPGISGLSVGITTTVKNVVVILSNLAPGENPSNTGFGNTEFFGDYVWGKIDLTRRLKAKPFAAFSTLQSGIGTNPVLRRKLPLKYDGYFV